MDLPKDQVLLLHVEPADDAASPDESAALHIEPAQRLPVDFVRKPGSARGQVRLAKDFDQLLPEFEPYT